MRSGKRGVGTGVEDHVKGQEQVFQVPFVFEAIFRCPFVNKFNFCVLWSCSVLSLSLASRVFMILCTVMRVVLVRSLV